MKALTGILAVLVIGLTLAAGRNGPAPRNDAWRIIGPGGGGAMFYPTISPHDPNDVLVRCDMSGAYITHDGGHSWRMFSLRQPVSFFAWDPVDRRTLYAYSIGLFRSTDEGKTWSLVFPRPEQVARVELPDDHAGERIVLKDGASPRMWAFAVDPADSKLLYAAITEAPRPPADGSLSALPRHCSLFVSRDAGVHWTKDADLPSFAKRIYVDPASPAGQRTLYVVGSNSVSVRKDGEWTQQREPFGANGFLDVAAGFERGAVTLYAVSGVQGGGGVLNVSDDGGSTWRHANIAPVPDGKGEPNVVAVAASLHHPATAYASYSRLAAANGKQYFGVAKTTDAGKTWELVWKETSTQPGENIHDAWLTARFGPGWGENPISVGVSPSDPNVCYGTDYGRTMRTTDGGATWTGVYSTRAGDGWTTTGLDVTTNYGVHFDPFDRKHMFISYTDIGLFESRDAGRSWASATLNGVPRAWVNTTYWMVFDPQVKGRAWAVMAGTHDLPRPKMWRRTGTARYRGGVVMSDDAGKTWRKWEGMPETAATHILLDPDSPAAARVLYVTGFARGVFKSSDGGKTWAQKNGGIQEKDPFAWRLARDRNGVLYLVVARRSERDVTGEGDGALYRSRDGAEHWEKVALPEGLNGPNGITVDPRDPSRLYLAAWARNAGPFGKQGGVWLSSDAGKTWTSVLSRDQHVYDVTIDPRNPNMLYASGFESSAWRSTDRGANWQRIRGFNFKWGHRVIPDPFDAAKIYVTTFGGSVWHGPAAGDPSAAEDIITPIPSGKE